MISLIAVIRCFILKKKKNRVSYRLDKRKFKYTDMKSRRYQDEPIYQDEGQPQRTIKKTKKCFFFIFVFI